MPSLPHTSPSHEQGECMSPTYLWRRSYQEELPLFLPSHPRRCQPSILDRNRFQNRQYQHLTEFINGPIFEGILFVVVNLVGGILLEISSAIRSDEIL